MQSKSYSYFISKNISVYVIFNDQRFKDTLTNNIVSFEQMGPDDSLFYTLIYSTISDNSVLKALIRLCGCTGRG